MEWEIVDLGFVFFFASRIDQESKENAKPIKNANDVIL